MFIYKTKIHFLCVPLNTERMHWLLHSVFWQLTFNFPIQDLWQKQRSYKHCDKACLGQTMKVMEATQVVCLDSMCCCTSGTQHSSAQLSTAQHVWSMCYNVWELLPKWERQRQREWHRERLGVFLEYCRIPEHLLSSAQSSRHDLGVFFFVSTYRRKEQMRHLMRQAWKPYISLLRRNKAGYVLLLG